MGRKDSLISGDLTDTHYYILLALMEPKHGYAIMQTVADVTQGHVNLGPGSVYKMTQKLFHAGYIGLWEKTDQRTVYVITERGIDVFQQDIQRRQAMIAHGQEALQQQGFSVSDPNKNM